MLALRTSVMLGVLSSVSGLSFTWQQIELLACFTISVSLNPQVKSFAP